MTLSKINAVFNNDWKGWDDDKFTIKSFNQLSYFVLNETVHMLNNNNNTIFSPNFNWETTIVVLVVVVVFVIVFVKAITDD